jgi:hypothetical protein
MEDLIWLLDHGYVVSKRDPSLLSAICDTALGLRAAADAAYMIFDPSDDAHGYLLVGNDLPAMLREARQHLDVA